MVKKFSTRFAWGLLGLLVLAALAIQLTGHGYFWKALSATYLQGHSTAHIDDAGNFSQRKIATSQPLALDLGPNQTTPLEVYQFVDEAVRLAQAH